MRIVALYGSNPVTGAALHFTARPVRPRLHLRPCRLPAPDRGGGRRSHRRAVGIRRLARGAAPARVHRRARRAAARSIDRRLSDITDASKGDGRAGYCGLRVVRRATSSGWRLNRSNASRRPWSFARWIQYTVDWYRDNQANDGRTAYDHRAAELALAGRWRAAYDEFVDGFQARAGPAD